MLRFGETKVTQAKFYASKRPIKIWNVNVDNMVVSNLVETKSNFKYLTGYLDKAIRLLFLIMLTLSGYIKTFKGKDGDKDKNNKVMSFWYADDDILYFNGDSGYAIFSWSEMVVISIDPNN